MMTRFVYALLLAAFSVSAQGQSREVAAGLVAAQCLHVEDTNLASAAIASGLCTMLLRGFTDGFVAGSSRGLRLGFVDDARNLGTVKDLSDLEFRLDLVRPKANCFPPAATVKQVADVFVHYMAAHPERIKEHYREPLVDAVQEYFCPR